MAKWLLIEEFHLTVKMPKDLPEAEYMAAKRVLDAKDFQADLRRAVRGVVKALPALGKVRITLSR